MTPLIDCYLMIDGVRMADTAQDWHDHKPVALADLSLSWGRRTVVDQPEAATTTFRVIDQAGGNSFLDVLRVGAPVDVWASGTISTGAATDVAVDGSFEAMALGDAGARVLQGPATVVNYTAFNGTKSLRITDDAEMWLTLGPDYFDIDGAPQSWDDIPTYGTGDHWTMGVAIRAGIDAWIKVYTMYLDGPRHDEESHYLPGGVWPSQYGNYQWQDRTFDQPSIDAAADGTWPGLRIYITLQTWAGHPSRPLTGTWDENPYIWNHYTGGWVDHVRFVQFTAPRRDVLVFSGEITDMRARTAAEGRIEVQATAIDQLADLANRYIGDAPWTTETVTTRIGRIVAGIDVDVLNIPTELGALMVGRRDVDRQPAGGLLQALASGIDAVLWSATHATTGPYLWFEDPQRRIAVSELQDQAGVIVIVGLDEEGSELDGCLLDGDVEWVRDVGDVITRIDASWQDQSTTPDVTERWVPTVVDAAAELDVGARHLSISTPLVNEADASTVATRMLARTRQLQWRAEQLVWPLHRLEPGVYEPAITALDLLDGTIRLGRGVMITNIAHWPVGESAGMYLDGGNYRYDEFGWNLELHTTPQAGFGDSVEWVDLHPPELPEGTPTSYIWFPNPAGNHVVTADVSFAPVDLVLTARIKLDGGATAIRTIAEHWRRSSGTNCWIWRCDSAGFPTLLWADKGIAMTRTCATAYPIGPWFWARVRLDSATPAGTHTVTFETSPNGTTWTVLQTITTAGTTRIDAGVEDPVSFGNARASALGLVGSIAELKIGDGAKTLIHFRAAYDLANQAPTTTGFNLTTGQAVTVARAGAPATTVTPPAVAPPVGPPWRWNQFHPDIDWDELWGVVAPDRN